MEYVRTAVTSYVEERLEIIKQQVLSRTKLMEIIDENNLYPEMRKQHTWGEIVVKMRKDISVKTISADVSGGRRGGGSSSATIAFMLSYTGKNPSVVQKVANILASQYLEENVRTRERRAATTTQYLAGELKAIKEELDNIEQKISIFKASHLGELPEYSEVNFQALTRLNRDREQINMQIRSLQERQVYLQGQLTFLETQFKTRSNITADAGNPALNPREHLERLQLELLARKAELSEKHPDIKRLKRQIAELEDQINKMDSATSELEKLTELQGQLAALKAKYGPKHPDVVKKTKEIESFYNRINQDDVLASSSDNPTLVNLKYQIASTKMEIEHLLAERKKIGESIKVYQQRIEKGPYVEREYRNLIRAQEHASRRYNEIMQELAEARAAQTLEETQKSERFTIIEPAHLPEKPYKPDRTAIILVGFILAIGAGAGFSGLRESMDATVKTADELSSLTGLPLLSVVPLITTDEQRRIRRLKIAALVIVGIIAIIAVLLAVHTFFMPLDILWIRIQRRLALFF
ncbi:MAG: hypothetical protein JRI34_04730 [Deltaproteobacteria bacterium]|nr:hypothetical protein [Deltaproteobacteria bacterium]